MFFVEGTHLCSTEGDLGRGFKQLLSSPPLLVQKHGYMMAWAPASWSGRRGGKEEEVEEERWSQRRKGGGRGGYKEVEEEMRR